MTDAEHAMAIRAAFECLTDTVAKAVEAGVNVGFDVPCTDFFNRFYISWATLPKLKIEITRTL